MQNLKISNSPVSNREGMEYTVSELVKDVRIAIDQNEVGDQLINALDMETLTLDQIITNKIVDAVSSVEKSAPIHLLDSGEPFAKNLGWKQAVGIGMGYTILPDDFMRLLTFQMSDWSRSVNEVITEDSPLYAMQSSRYSGIKGCPQKPVCALVLYPVGYVLEFYSCVEGKNVFVKRARYLPYPSIQNDTIRICEKCYRSVVYYLAGLVCSSYGGKDQADLLFGISKDLLV